MYTATIENKKGEMLTLTGQEAIYQIISIQGLNPPQAQINMTNIVGLDGAKYNSAKLETRNIVMTIKINGNVERNRQNLYLFFQTKEWCKFYYTNENRNVYIEAYVESFECDFFSNSEMAQVSLICPYPYFKDLEEITDDISNVTAAFSFPFSINIGSPIPFSIFDHARTANVFNASESETGVIIEIDFSASVDEIMIRNVGTGDTFTLDYEFLSGDRVTINTNKGQKSVSLLRNGATINLFSAMQRGSVFFQLAVGDNEFGYLADDGENNGNVFIYFSHYNTYRGV